MLKDLNYPEILLKSGDESYVPDYVDSIIVGRSGFYEFDSTSMSIVNSEFVDNSNKWVGGGMLSISGNLAKFGWSFHTGQLVSDSLKLI